LGANTGGSGKNLIRGTWRPVVENAEHAFPGKLLIQKNFFKRGKKGKKQFPKQPRNAKF
jgi:hypothetical protein